jgi:hypothetical protein
MAVTFSFDLGSASAATSKIESAEIRVTHASGAIALETTVAVASGSVSSGALEIPLEVADETLTAEVALLGGGLILFQGSETLQATPGSMLSFSVPVEPVVSRVAVEGPLPVFEAIGDELPLVGYAIWSDGDTIPGAQLEWSSENPTVAEIVGSDRLVSRGEGETTVRGELGGRFETQQARVEAVVVTVVIEPEDLTLPRGSEFQLTGIARDANGNDLVRDVDWASMDPAIAAVDATGVLLAVNPGITAVIADVSEVLGTTDVEVTPAPPTLSPLEASEAGSRSIDLTANVNPNGAPTTAYLEWSLTEDFEAPNPTPSESLGGGLDDVRLETRLARLDPSTDHFVRLIASNSFGQTIGEAVAFRTADPTGGFIEGFLMAEGEPIADAVVRLDSEQTTTTDAEGAYAFDDVSLGAHTVTVVDLPVGVTVSEPTASGEIQTIGELLRLDFEGEILRTSSVRGRVTGSDIGVPGVTVILTGPDDRTVTTESDGTYAFEAIRAGSYTVTLDGFDRIYLSFDPGSKEVTVGLDEEGAVDFSGVDTDILDVTVHAFVGIDGSKPGLSPAPGIEVGVFATSSDASTRNAPLGSASTDDRGEAVIRIRKRDDVGEDGGSSDGRVWSGVISTGSGHLSIQADRVMGVSFSPDATTAAAPDTIDVLNGRARIRVGVETIKTSASDSGLRLQSWKVNAYDEPGGSTIASASSQSGNAVVTISRSPSELPQKVYFRLDSDQSQAYGEAWVQSTDPAGAGSASGGYLQYTADGLEPINGSVNVGKLVVRYTTMVIFTTGFHEVDNTSSGPVKSQGDNREGATAIGITLKRNGSTVETRGLTSTGGVVFRRLPVPSDYTLTAASTDSNITILTPSTLTVGSTGGGSVGRTDSQGGYRHSARVCPVSADTIIANCAGWAYKFNNTAVTGTVTRSGGGGAGGVEVRLARCRTPQSTSASTCVAEDGFVQTRTTSGSGGFSFTGLLEGIYEVSVTGSSVSTLVATRGNGNRQTANLVIP